MVASFHALTVGYIVISVLLDYKQSSEITRNISRRITGKSTPVMHATMQITQITETNWLFLFPVYYFRPKANLQSCPENDTELFKW